MRVPILNIGEAEFAREMKHGDKFDARIAPGKCAFAFHNHHANEELCYVIEGTGMLDGESLDYWHGE